MDYKPEYFFKLAKSQHKEIFNEVESAWDVLLKISDYLSTRPLGKIHGCVNNGAHLVDEDQIFIGKGTINHHIVDGVLLMLLILLVRHSRFLLKSTCPCE